MSFVSMDRKWFADNEEVTSAPEGRYTVTCKSCTMGKTKRGQDQAVYQFSFVEEHYAPFKMWMSFPTSEPLEGQTEADWGTMCNIAGLDWLRVAHQTKIEWDDDGLDPEGLVGETFEAEVIQEPSNDDPNIFYNSIRWDRLPRENAKVMEAAKEKDKPRQGRHKPSARERREAAA